MTLIYIAIGLAAGILSGMFGIGGGILIVPALAHFAKMPFKEATGTSLGALLLPVGLLGALTYHRSGNLDPKAALLIAAGILFGAFGGAKLAEVVSGSTMQRAFSVFLVLVAVRLWFEA
jgi:uncharacterized membrane protein YfcA